MTSKNTVALFSIFLLFGGPYSCLARVNPYTRKDNGNRTIIWRVMLLFAAAGMLSACGGGGGSDGGGNIGWVQIHVACSGGSSSCIDFSGDPPYTTIDDTITVGGTAFISPTGNEPCSETFGASDTASTISLTGVTINWVNQTTGFGSPASQHASSVTLFFFVFCDHTWQTSVPLAIGDNVFTVTASDSAGNVGQAAVAITRI